MSETLPARGHKFAILAASSTRLCLTVTVPLTLSLALVAVLSVGCRSSKNTDANETVPIVLDNWWTIDFVKNGCEMQANEAQRGNPYARPCQNDVSPEDTVRSFEQELQVSFASEAACHGLSLVQFTPEMANNAAKDPNAPATGATKALAEKHWTLMFDLQGNTETQEGSDWSLVDPSQHVFNGRITNSQRLALDVCKIVKGVGGKTD
jgi:hypothetical protein